MTTKIFLHGSGHRANSWTRTLSYLSDSREILRPNLDNLLDGKNASYDNLCRAFAAYCDKIPGKLDLCDLSLGGILALNYTLNHPEKVRSLVLIGTPHKVPKLLFSVQNLLFRLIPASAFKTMAFDKADTFVLGETMKDLDFSDRVKAIRCPTLILCGEKDNANRAAAVYLSDHIPNAQLRLIPHTGHIVNEESPQALAALLDTFYAQIKDRR